MSAIGNCDNRHLSLYLLANHSIFPEAATKAIITIRN